MTELYILKIKEFLWRWGRWIAGAFMLVMALAATRRADRRVERLRDNQGDSMDEEIAAGWDGIDNATDDLRGALKRSDEVRENAQKQLDRIAQTDRSAADIISDWNADNRLPNNANTS